MTTRDERTQIDNELTRFEARQRAEQDERDTNAEFLAAAEAKLAELKAGIDLAQHAPAEDEFTAAAHEARDIYELGMGR